MLLFSSVHHQRRFAGTDGGVTGVCNIASVGKLSTRMLMMATR